MEKGKFTIRDSFLALDDIGPLFKCGDDPLVLTVLFIFST